MTKQPPFIKPLRTWSLAACLALTSNAFEAGEKPGPPWIVTIQTRDLTVELSADRAWTISRIVHQGKIITDRTGFYGTVFAPEGGKWIGTGHNEGGIEKVGSATLTVDGKDCALTDKAVYRGQRVELRKQSMMGPIQLEATYVVTDAEILETHRYEFTEAVNVGTLYAFMHPFVPTTTEWMAETVDSRILDGTFDSQGSNRLRDDVRWTAIHDPMTQRVTVLSYPKPLTGQGLKTFYWDKTVYHKLYNQIYSHATVPAGTKVEAEVVLRCTEATTETWKQKARALIELSDR